MKLLLSMLIPVAFIDMILAVAKVSYNPVRRKGSLKGTKVLNDAILRVEDFEEPKNYSCCYSYTFYKYYALNSQIQRRCKRDNTTYS